MSLKAGRVGVNPADVDQNGHISGGSITIPDATRSVKGVVSVGDGISVTSGKIKVSDPIPQRELSDSGKVLTVGVDGSAEWDSIPSEIPEYAIAQAGKVLAVSNDGASLEWVEQSQGGGGIVEVFDSTVSGIRISSNGTSISSGASKYGIVDVTGYDTLIIGFKFITGQPVGSSSTYYIWGATETPAVDVNVVNITTALNGIDVDRVIGSLSVTSYNYVIFGQAMASSTLEYDFSEPNILQIGKGNI